MRKSTGSRQSLAPLRVRNSTCSSITGRSSSRDRYSMDSAFSSGSRASINSLGPKRLSYGQQSNRRTSSYGRTKGTESMKDPRHMTDRSYKDRSIKRLIEFLSSSGYPHKLGLKTLQAPTTKDFLNVFEFLVVIIEGKFRLDGKHEEQIPRILKQLGYPFTITKNMLCTVGAPHIWPHLLGSLMWLVEYVQSSSECDTTATLFSRNDDFEKDSEQLLTFKYVVSTYSAFMFGRDDFPEEDEEYKRELERIHDDSPVNLKSVQSEHQHLLQELENLENEPDRLEYLTETRNKYQLEYKEFLDQAEEMNRKKFEMEKQLRDELAKTNNIELEMSRMSNEKERMQIVYDTQDLSQDEVKRINMSRKELSRQTRIVEEDILEIEKRKWTLEMEIGKLQEQVDKVFNALNQAYIKLKVAAPDDATHTLAEVQNDAKNIFTAEARMKLKNLFNEVNERVLKSKVNGENKNLFYQLDATLNEITQENLMLDNKIKRLSNEMDIKKESHLGEDKKLQDEIDEIEGRIKEGQMFDKHSSLSEVKAEFNSKSNMFKQQIQQTLQRKEEWQEFLTTVTEIVIEHKTIMEEHFRSLAERTKAMYEEYLAVNDEAA